MATTISERTGYSAATDTSATLSVQDALNSKFYVLLKCPCVCALLVYVLGMINTIGLLFWMKIQKLFSFKSYNFSLAISANAK